MHNSKLLFFNFLEKFHNFLYKLNNFLQIKCKYFVNMFNNYCRSLQNYFLRVGGIGRKIQRQR